MSKSKMPPQLLAHFKKKQGDQEGSGEDAKKSDKDRRKEAVKKARIRMEEKNKGRHRDKKEEAGQERAEKS